MKINLKNLTNSKLQKMDEEELKNLISELDNLRIESHQNNKFLEANEYKNKIKMIEKIYQKTCIKDIKKEKDLNNDKIESEFENELEELEGTWDQRLQSFKEESEQLEYNLIEKNKSDLESYFEKINNEIPKEKKDSTKLKELKISIEKCANNQNYEDAHFLTKKYDKIKDEEDKIFEIERENKIRNLIEIKEKKLEIDLENFRKNILSKFTKMELDKRSDEDALKKKYNKKKIKNEKEFKNLNNNFQKSVKISSIVIRY